MDSSKVVQVRVRREGDNRPWEEIPYAESTQTMGELADWVLFLFEDIVEVRMNFRQSFQGHYFQRPSNGKEMMKDLSELINQFEAQLENSWYFAPDPDNEGEFMVLVESCEQEDKAETILKGWGGEEKIGVDFLEMWRLCDHCGKWVPVSEDFAGPGADFHEESQLCKVCALEFAEDVIAGSITSWQGWNSYFLEFGEVVAANMGSPWLEIELEYRIASDPAVVQARRAIRKLASGHTIIHMQDRDIVYVEIQEPRTEHWEPTIAQWTTAVLQEAGKLAAEVAKLGDFTLSIRVLPNAELKLS